MDPRKNEKPQASFRLLTENPQQGDLLLASGRHWPLHAIHFRIGKKEIRPSRLLQGNHWEQFIVPDSSGNFLVEFSTAGLEPGKYVLEALTADELVVLKERLVVDPRLWPGKDVPREKVRKPVIRAEQFNRLRFDLAKGVPNGALERARIDWARLHRHKGPVTHWDGNHGGVVFFSAPVPGACNWTPMGPAPYTEGPGSLFTNNSGRITSLALHPTMPVIYAGTASGGIWKSEDDGRSWVPLTDDKFSLAVGALAIDPVTASTVYAGTGEYVPNSTYYYYGKGLLKSTTSGASWTEIGGADFLMAEIARIVIDPLDTSKVYVAGSNGVWESVTSGASWSQLSASPATDLVLVRNPAEPGVKRLIGGFANIGVQGAMNSGGAWTAFSTISVPGMPVNPSRTALGVCRDHLENMYAAFSEPMGSDMLAHVAYSSTYGSSWSACTIPSVMTGRIYQASYNLVITPHPTIPSTVVLGVVDVFMSTDTGGSWTKISSGGGHNVHPDVHAIAFSPTDPNKIYVGCDGGLEISTDLGAHWEARNQDISSIQLYDFGQHPQYEAIMIAGSQDNGGFHYMGAPIWRRTWVTGVSHNTMGGDAVVATIDPFDARYHYYGTGPESSLARSDDAGRFFTTGISKPAGSPWWTPFFTDPRTPGVILIGGTTLVRSEDRGNTVSNIATGLAGGVRSIGFHPADTLVLYAGTQSGHVYRIQGPPAGAWTTATVTTTEVTYTGLPAGVEISGLAVDPAGNVWATTSSLLQGEAPNEFSNQHVYRLDAGTTVWVERSSGLAAANPVNTIVIDPADASKVYCGADRGVFVWNAGSSSWDLYDQGLPNSPVMLLKIHGPSRKLRAATYGRGLWERYLDGLVCEDHFLYMRSHIADAGAEPVADGVAHPYLPGYQCWHWQSPDIVVDPAMQTPSVVTTAMELADKVRHYGGRRGNNRVYVTVHNKGPFRVTNVRVRAFFAPAGGGLPAFSPGLLSNPFTWTPAMGDVWKPVGTVFSIAAIEPGTTKLAYWDSAVIPMDAPSHYCVLAFVTSDQDPFSVIGAPGPDALVLENRRVALKNLDLDGPAYPDSTGNTTGEGGGTPSGGSGVGSPPGFSPMRELRLSSTEKEGSYYEPAAYSAALPKDAVIIFITDKATRKKLQLPDHKTSPLEKKAIAAFDRVKGKFGDLKKFDLDNIVVREAKRHAHLSFGHLRITSKETIDTRFCIWSPAWDPEEEYSVDLLQQQGRRVVGGFTVIMKGIR